VERLTPSVLAIGVHGALLGAHPPRRGELVSADHGRAPSEPLAGACRGEARAGPLADDLALKLGKRTEDVELHPAGRSGRVDLLGQRAEPDLAVVQLFDELNEMF